MSSMTEKMSKSARSGANQQAEVPKKGDHFRCQQCGMEFEITTACKCGDPDHSHFECCGQTISKV